MLKRAAIGATALLCCSCVTLDRQFASAAPSQAPVAAPAPAEPQSPEFQRLKREIEEHIAATREPSINAELAERLAQMGIRLDALERDLAQVKGTVEELQVASRQPAAPAAESAETARLRSELADLATRVEALSRSVAVRPAGATPPSIPPATGGALVPAAPLAPAAPPAASQAPVDPKKLYDDAYALYREGKYAASQEKFRQYIATFPDTALTDNAHFWIGEAFYDQGQYEQAILQYDKVIQNFPTGDKVSSALLKQAFAFDAIGDQLDAKILLNKIVSEHAGSEQAAIARRKLETLKN